MTVVFLTFLVLAQMEGVRKTGGNLLSTLEPANLPQVPHCPIHTPPPPFISYARVQATVGVGTVIIVYVILIAYGM